MDKFNCDKYGRKLLIHLYNLYKHGELCDLALEVGKRTFNVHKVVLTGASQFFKTQLENGNFQEPIYVLQNLSSKAAEAIIEFMYTGSLCLTLDTIWLVFTAATVLDMPQVLSLCEEFLKGNPTTVQVAYIQDNPQLPMPPIDTIITALPPEIKLESENTIDIPPPLKKTKTQKFQSSEEVKNVDFQRQISLGDTDSRNNAADNIGSECGDVIENEEGPDISENHSLQFKRTQQIEKTKNNAIKLDLRPAQIHSIIQDKDKATASKLDHVTRKRGRPAKQSSVSISSRKSSSPVRLKTPSPDKKQRPPMNEIELHNHHTYSAVNKPSKVNQAQKVKTVGSDVAESERVAKVKQKRNINFINLRSLNRVHLCRLCNKKFHFRSSLVLHRHLSHAVHRSSLTYTNRPLYFTRLNSFKTFIMIRSNQSKINRHTAVVNFMAKQSSKTANIPNIIRRKSSRLSSYKTDANTDILASNTRKSRTIQEDKPVLKPYVCVMCGRIFKKLKHLHSHLHTRHYRRSCKYCAMERNNERVNVRHLRRHFLCRHLEGYDRKRRLYKCGICLRYRISTQKVFAYKRNLRYHLTNVHYVAGNRNQNMNIKQEKEEQNREIKAENKKKTGVKSKSVQRAVTIWKCEQEDCSFQSKSKKLLLSHMQECHKTVKFECLDCSYTTPLHKDLNNHMVSQHMSKECCVCKRYFARSSQLALHKFTAHSIEAPGFTILRCEADGCDYVCVSNNMLYKHQKGHKEEKSHQCEECGKQLKSALTLQKHISKIHKGIKPFMCEVCGVSYAEESELKIHINRHGKTKNFHCDLCQYSCYDKGNFKSHMFNRHNVKITKNMKTFSCNICNYVTDVKYRYTDHMRVHLNMRDIECPDCDKSFMTRKALRGHVIKVHKPKNLRCDFCRFATADPSKLKEHVRVIHTHRNFKPYKCAYCSFTCTTGGNCRKHVMQKHRGLDVNVVKLDLELPTGEVPSIDDTEAYPSQQDIEDTFELETGNMISKVLANHLTTDSITINKIKKEDQKKLNVNRLGDIINVTTQQCHILNSNIGDKITVHNTLQNTFTTNTISTTSLIIQDNLPMKKVLPNNGHFAIEGTYILSPSLLGSSNITQQGKNLDDNTSASVIAQSGINSNNALQGCSDSGQNSIIPVMGELRESSSSKNGISIKNNITNINSSTAAVTNRYVGVNQGSSSTPNSNNERSQSIASSGQEVLAMYDGNNGGIVATPGGTTSFAALSSIGLEQFQTIILDGNVQPQFLARIFSPP